MFGSFHCFLARAFPINILVIILLIFNVGQDCFTKSSQSEQKSPNKSQNVDPNIHRTSSILKSILTEESSLGIKSEGLDLSVLTLTGNKTNSTTRNRDKRADLFSFSSDCEVPYGGKPNILGLRCDGCETAPDGTIIVKAGEENRVLLFGRNLYNNISIALTPTQANPSDDCTHIDRIKTLPITNTTLNIAELVIDIQSVNQKIPYFFCIREASDSRSASWFHQGSEKWQAIYVKQDLIPVWLKIIIIACLLGLSGLFSGLNLGLMSLDKNELQVIMKCGSEAERRYASLIEPVRRRGNYLLCSILFSNTLVNSTIAVLLEELSGGSAAVASSTILIVMFGEILPQAICSRHGLAVGANTILLTKTCMILTFPLSYPVSYCLDWALGEELGHAYDRERLMEFIQVTRNINNLETDEVNIISGALKLKQIHINEIMTRIEDVYMLDEMAVLDFDTIQQIVEKGYSRIPVHEANNPKNIVAVLFAKDLALVDPDDKTPVQTMITFYNHPRMFVYEDSTLDMALNEFKTGKSHMAIVQRIVEDYDKDPYPEITGIVTLEDVIEEIMQMEINDETDTLTDNRRKRRRKEAQVRKDFAQFTNLGAGDSSIHVVSSQLCLAAYLYLAANVKPFSQAFLSDLVLKRLLSQRIFYKIRIEDDEKQKRLYTSGQPADYFIMILEGKVHVQCGRENLFFDAGPFSHFGKGALIQQVDQNDRTSHSPDSQLAPADIKGAIPLLTRRDSSIKPRISPIAKRTERTSELDASQLLAGVSSAATPSAHICNVDTSDNLIATCLSQEFVPDYTVDIIATTSYLKVTRKDYMAALKATMVERGSATLQPGDYELGVSTSLAGSRLFLAGIE